MEPALFERGVIRDAGGGAGWEAGWEWAVHAAVDRGGTRCADVVCMHMADMGWSEKLSHEYP